MVDMTDRDLARQSALDARERSRVASDHTKHNPGELPMLKRYVKPTITEVTLPSRFKSASELLALSDDALFVELWHMRERATPLPYQSEAPYFSTASFNAGFGMGYDD